MFPLICESLDYLISRKSMWGQITIRKAEGPNSGEIPLWRLISSMNPEKVRSLALMTHGEVDVWGFLLD